jgi:osmoprotectant transport system permease protein
LQEAFQEAYQNGRDLAVAETDLPLKTFPPNCLYILEEILDSRLYPGEPSPERENDFSNWQQLVITNYPMIIFINRYGAEIIQRATEHLYLVTVAIFIAISVGIPLGILVTRKPKLKKPILGFANIMQTIPSLALFGLLIPVPVVGGIGDKTAIIALTLYSLLPIIRNTYTGIVGVDRAITQAGIGMGMTDMQLLWQVEIPLALGVILAGVRVATVIAIGLATIAAAIGAGGLGVFIFRGVATVNNQLLLAGAIPAALMALAADFGLGLVEARLSKSTLKTINDD